MKYDYKNLAMAIFFFLIDIFSIYTILSEGISTLLAKGNSYFIVAAIVSTIIAIGFFKRAKK